jgi:hypothetical protein
MCVIAMTGRLGLDDVRPRGCMRGREETHFFLVLHNIDVLPLDIHIFFQIFIFQIL